MDSAQADRQIQQMLSFIRSGAEDKVNEIRIKADEESNLEKQRAIEEAKILIDDAYKRRTHNVGLERKVLRSKVASECKMDVLEAQDKLIHTTLHDSLVEAIRGYTNDEDKYRSLLHTLISDAVMLLKHSNVKIHCRTIDRTLIEEGLAEISAGLGDAGFDVGIEVCSDSKFIDDSCLGGVVVTSIDEKIRADNTLDYRLRKCLTSQMPLIKDRLFNVNKQG
ncbi:hypothetical protein P9112_011628 [Eukaryota sp. TZLM1-RC]